MEREDWLNSTDPRRAAAAWHAVMSSEPLPESDRIAFSDWLLKSPTHVEEYARLSAVREQLLDPSMFDGISLDELIGRIDPKVESLSQADPERRVRDADIPTRRLIRRRFSRPAFAIAASLLLACVLGVAAWHEPLSSWFSDLNSTVDYATAIGEQRSIVLPDGSIAELNTRSKLSLHFDAATREAILNDGEALFRVAKDAKRAFRVYSGDTVVQALGTEFTVRRDANRTTVTVLEGRVSVAPSSPESSASISQVELGASQRIVVAAGKAIDARTIEKIDTESALAWKARRLVFDDSQLDEVVAEFNRYNTRQIRLEGVELEKRAITGVFNANDPDSFLAFLQGAEGVTVDGSGSGDILVRPRERSRGGSKIF
jgi:transmembrane sensor